MHFVFLVNEMKKKTEKTKSAQDTNFIIGYYFDILHTFSFPTWITVTMVSCTLLVFLLIQSLPQYLHTLGSHNYYVSILCTFSPLCFSIFKLVWSKLSFPWWLIVRIISRALLGLPDIQLLYKFLVKFFFCLIVTLETCAIIT